MRTLTKATAEGTGKAYARRSFRGTALVAVSSLLLSLALAGVANAASPAGANANWTTSATVPSGGFNSLDETVHIDYESVPAPGQVNQAYFFARQFGLTASANAGYIGIQTDAGGKRAVFSMWGAVGRCTGPGRTNADADGTQGCSMLLPYPWVAGKDYRLHIARTGREAATCGGVPFSWCPRGADSWVWTGSVIDPTGAETVIGSFSTTASWGGLSNWAGNFVEWYAPHPATCQEYPPIRGRWSNVTADGSIRFDRVDVGTSPGQCTATAVRDGNTVVVAMGWDAMSDHPTVPPIPQPQPAPVPQPAPASTPPNPAQSIYGYSCATPTGIGPTSATIGGVTSDPGVSSAMITVSSSHGAVVGQTTVGYPFKTHVGGLSPSTAYSFAVTFNPVGRTISGSACTFTTASDSTETSPAPAAPPAPAASPPSVAQPPTPVPVTPKCLILTLLCG